MRIGTGIVLIVIGAILTFAVNVEVAWVNLDLIGYIFMAAGLVVLIFGIVFMMRKRQSVSEVRSAVDPANGEQVTRRTTSQTDDTVL
jgi:cytochrome c oxidase subunit IV